MKMRNALIGLALIGIYVYVGASFIHAAHGEDGGTSLRMAEATVGKVTEPAPVAWKLRVTIFNKDGSPKDIMVMVNPDHTPRLWLSLDACNAFMDTDEYKKSLPPLAEYLVAQGYDLDDGLTFTCVPAQPTVPLVQ